MATINFNYDPNARYDIGANAAGCGGTNMAWTQVVLGPLPAYFLGLQTDGVKQLSTLRVGFSAAGVDRNNGGPNVAGNPRGWSEI